MKIPARCVHCGGVLDAWDRTNQHWGECTDCREWQAWLWHQRPPQPVDETALLAAIAEAMAEGDT
jgi:hypothetical protein